MTGPVCDFCNEQTSTWRYPTRDFGVFVVGGRKVSNPIDLSGGWWACDHCQPYIEDGRYDELARYTHGKWLAEQVVPPNRKTGRFVRATHREMYRAFERNRCGEPTRYVRRRAMS